MVHNAFKIFSILHDSKRKFNLIIQWIFINATIVDIKIFSFLLLLAI